MGRDEASTQSAILAWLKGHGFWAWRVTISNARGTGGAPSPMVGHPDIAGILPGSLGRYFAIEVKAKGGKFRPKQLEWAARAQTEKVLYLVAYSLGDVVTAFATHLPLSKSERADALESLPDFALDVPF